MSRFLSSATAWRSAFDCKSRRQIASERCRCWPKGPGAAALDETTADRPEATDALEPGVRKVPVAVFVAAAGALGLLAFALNQVTERPTKPTAPSSDQTVEEDINGDGEPDSFSTHRGGLWISSNEDTNFDGKIDEWTRFDQHGRRAHSESDSNFDGRADNWYTYRNGMIESSRGDTDFNGVVDCTIRYEQGRAVQTDVAPNESPVVTRRYVHTHGLLREEWVDENKDGVFDYKIMHDPFGEMSERIPLVQPR